MGEKDQQCKVFWTPINIYKLESSSEVNCILHVDADADADADVDAGSIAIALLH